MRIVSRALPLVAIVAFCLIPATQQAAADNFGSYAFQRIWNRTDEPVAAHSVNRTWMWGPQPFTGIMLEPFADGNVAGQQGVRRVQYFDKSRMEITDTNGDPNSEWYVTNGLLAREMITGKMQVGNNSFIDYGPANINVAGDENDADAPTYATFQPLMSYNALPDGWTVTQTVDRQGHVGNNQSTSGYGVTAGHYVGSTKHDIASVFWDFMNASGPTFNGFQTADAKLFNNPFFATGLPITEPYWISVKVGGSPKAVLVQAFERRVLTYTPDNSDGWKVEAGNVGRHYYEWRYGTDASRVFTTSNVSASKDMNGNWVFLGEVTNNARTAYSNVTITVKLLDATGGEIATKSAFLDSSSIEPNQTLPFRVWFDSGPRFDHYDVSVAGVVDPFASPAPLSLVVTTSAYLASGDYHIRATIQNTSDKPVSRPSYVVTLVGVDGRLLDYDSGFLTLSAMQPGESATADVTFYDPPRVFAGYRTFTSR